MHRDLSALALGLRRRRPHQLAGLKFDRRLPVRTNLPLRRGIAAMKRSDWFFILMSAAIVTIAAVGVATEYQNRKPVPSVLIVIDGQTSGTPSPAIIGPRRKTE